MKLIPASLAAACAALALHAAADEPAPVFQMATGAKHALQVVLDREYDGADCFRGNEPRVVSARTFLSQLVKL